MRILFILSLTSIVRHFESVILALADRGHTITIASPGDVNNCPLPDVLVKHPRISEVICPAERGDRWRGTADHFRMIVDYVRYFDAPFAGMDKLRERAFTTLLAGLTERNRRPATTQCPSCKTNISGEHIGRMLLSGRDPGFANFKKILHLIEGAIPSDPARDTFLKEVSPDVVLVSPLVGLGSEQAEWVKSARALEIPVGFPVFSWDNLTTKGIIHVQPDCVFVWNAIQKQEAIALHGMPADRVHATGAPRFDAFIALKPKRLLTALCAKHGLDPNRPILTYLCSSEFVAGGEMEFIGRWIDEIRADATLAKCNILLRPHPRTVRQWAQFDASRWPLVGVSKSSVLNADQKLYDTLYHSAAVIGLNTSAQIEAGILGKPVYTILAPGFEQGQQGTLHFRHLLREEGGFVEVARDFDEHRRHLSDALAGRYDARQIRDFIERFIRPAGFSAPATPLLADAIERLAPANGFSTVKRWLKSASIR